MHHGWCMRRATTIADIPQRERQKKSYSKSCWFLRSLHILSFVNVLHAAHICLCVLQISHRDSEDSLSQRKDSLTIKSECCCSETSPLLSKSNSAFQKASAGVRGRLDGHQPCFDLSPRLKEIICCELNMRPQTLLLVL